MIAFATDFPAARESSVFVVLNYSRLDVRELKSPTASRERRLVFGRRYSDNAVIPSGSDALFPSARPVNHPSNQRLYLLLVTSVVISVVSWVNFGTNCSFTERRRCFFCSVVRCLRRNLCSLLFHYTTSSRCLSIDLSFVKLFHASCKPIVGDLFARKCSPEEECSGEASNLEVEIYHFDYHVDHRWDDLFPFIKRHLCYKLLFRSSTSTKSSSVRSTKA